MNIVKDTADPGIGHLGKDGCAKWDEFSEKFQTAFDPPPSCSENYVANLFMMDMVEYMQGGTRARQYEMHAHDFQRWGVGDHSEG